MGSLRLCSNGKIWLYGKEFYVGITRHSLHSHLLEIGNIMGVIRLNATNYIMLIDYRPV